MYMYMILMIPVLSIKLCVYININSLLCFMHTSIKPLWSGMGEVVAARTSPTLHPPSPPTVL